MQRIYANRGLATRMNISCVVVVGSFILGGFELWHALRAGPDNAGNGYLFALLFLGGGFYAGRQIILASLDTVVFVDGDPDGEGTVALWRPFGAKRIAGPLARLSGWRAYAKQVRRNVRISMLLADHPDYPRPLEFELGQGIAIDDRFKALAAEASGVFGPPEEEKAPA